MARKNKNKKSRNTNTTNRANNQNNPKQAQVTQKEKDMDELNKMAEVHTITSEDKVDAAAFTEEEKKEWEAMEKAEAEKNISDAFRIVKVLFDKGRKEAQELSKKEKDLELKLKKLETDQEKLRKDKEAIKTETDANEKKLAEHKKEEERLLEFQNELTDKKGQILLKETEAEKGFPSKHQAFIDELEATKNKLDEKQKELADSYEEKFNKLNGELTQAKLDVKKKEIELEDELLFLKEDRAYLNKKVQQKSEHAILKVENEKEYLKNSLELYKEEAEKLKGQLREANKSLFVFGEREPDEVLEELETLKNVNQNLKDQLTEKADKEIEEDYEQLKLEEQKWRQERTLLKKEIALMKSQALDYKIVVSEKYKLELLQDSTENRLNIARTALEDLKREVGEYSRKSEAQHTFEYCSSMDANEGLQQPRENLSSIGSLKNMVTFLQERMATVEETPLYYSQKVIRTFLSGLAIGKLTLLQGISGTGKTSLPRAFVKAITGKSSIIEVQSGWRDRQDLLGYFNTFENKYYESLFLQSLYEASCPNNSDSIYFIILDEMNLSHPEHYFTDILSVMEDNSDEQKIKINTPNRNLPRLFNENTKGITLDLPPNVWFIGTANQDETTLQFAPKTYDRANVLEMPKNIAAPPRVKKNKSEVYSYKELNELFKEAETKQKAKSKEAITFFNEELKPLVHQFGLGWGNRLEKQLKKFLPVYVESGGAAGDAVDHLLASKVLRSLKGRYDLRVDQLKKLKDDINEAFSASKSFNIEPVDSNAIISGELFRLGEKE